MGDTTFIYGLYNILDDKKEIRYVGKSDNPKKRLIRHINNTKYNSKNSKKLTHKENWIIKCDYNIGFTILNECDNSDWGDVERRLIKIYPNLTNTSLGGEGGSGVKYNITYEECKKIVKKLNIESKNDWFNNIDEIPEEIPKYSRQKYLNNGWVSWGDFLGTGRICDNYVDYFSYDEAKKIIKKFSIKKVVDYKNMAKNGEIPKKIPNRPERYYKNRGWCGWSDFLGVDIIANQNKVFYDLKTFKEKIKEMGIKTMTNYRKYCLSEYRDDKMPTNPLIVYRREQRGVSWVDIINS